MDICNHSEDGIHKWSVEYGCEDDAWFSCDNRIETKKRTGHMCPQKMSLEDAADYINQIGAAGESKVPQT